MSQADNFKGSFHLGSLHALANLFQSWPLAFDKLDPSRWFQDVPSQQAPSCDPRNHNVQRKRQQGHDPALGALHCHAWRRGCCYENLVPTSQSTMI